MKFYVAYDVRPPFLPLGVYDTADEMKANQVGNYTFKRVFVPDKELDFIDPAPIVDDNLHPLVREAMRIRFEKRIKMIDVARQAGIGYRTIMEWESGRRGIRGTNLEKLRRWIENNK